jgi:hypothetical protein
MIGENVLVRVMWGPREESAAQVADRWLAAVAALAAVDPELLGRWVRPRENEQGGLDLDPLDDPAVALAVIEGGRAKPPQTGFSVRGWNARRGAGEVSFKASAGSRSKVTPNVAYLEFTPGTGEEARRWAGLAQPALLALVSAWEPDHGNVWTRDLMDAQQPAAREPFAGYVTYLSAGRCRGPAGELPGAARTPDGGLVIATPSTEDAVALGATLRGTDAFAPVPKDRPRWSVE